MKKRIISAILVVVMLVLSLASCGAYDFSEEDLSSYVTVDYDKLIDRQLERAAITCTAGFAKIFPDSGVVLSV